jgi:steroid delta-isomerase-like uncharacterized protein
MAYGDMAMSQENKALIERWFEQVWNKGNEQAIGDLLHDDGVIHGLNDTSGSPVRSAAAFREFHRQFRGAFPDITITVDDMISEGDKVAARCSVRGKHSGHSLGMTPTNADVEFTGIAIVRIRDGKIVEAWNNFDFLKMNQQLGIL